MNKKLQVFVSSTYTDLIEERQAAVEAILDAGHIPAGMELFKAGESQMKTIKKWIDDSDVYMLIVGGRYGSIDEESGKSYTHLEYEYALSKKMPTFAVILEDNYLYTKAIQIDKESIFEKYNTDKYISFVTIVKSNIVKFVKNIDQISTIVHSQLNDIADKNDLLGWIRNTQENDTAKLLSINETLLKENLSLKEEAIKLREQIHTISKEQIGNYSYDELVKILSKKRILVSKKFLESDADRTFTALILFILNFKVFCSGLTNKISMEGSMKEFSQFLLFDVCPILISFGLMEKVNSAEMGQITQTSKSGFSFYAMLEAKRMTDIG
ncbi:DUF4062 domain-containing protein [Lacrimispora sp.]|uniref:DUF4062 domain-containing protein n=1 Tax=Lacrimispora sp. TaxID=2719234 RepID=UPI0028A7066C|nr:DUF4062 domain-containing protein [Lacrimispora sp.]